MMFELTFEVVDNEVRFGLELRITEMGDPELHDKMHIGRHTIYISREVHALIMLNLKAMIWNKVVAVLGERAAAEMSDE